MSRGRLHLCPRLDHRIELIVEHVLDGLFEHWKLSVATAGSYTVTLSDSGSCVATHILHARTPHRPIVSLRPLVVAAIDDELPETTNLAHRIVIERSEINPPDSHSPLPTSSNHTHIRPPCHSSATPIT